jgi:hypothetical protein
VVDPTFAFFMIAFASIVASWVTLRTYFLKRSEEDTDEWDPTAEGDWSEN